MIYAQDTKKVVLEPASFTNAATASVVIDRLGFDYASIDALVGRSNNATNVPSVFKLQESDITNATGYADISGASFTSTYTTASTTAADALTYDVDCRARKRYLKLLISPVTTQIIAAVANLSRGKQTPATAADKNVQGWLVL